MSLFRSLLHARSLHRSHVIRNFVRYSSTSTSEPIDHQTLAKQQKLVLNSEYSPGSPLFQPAGAHILNSLISCLRAHYPAYGFQEVLTPTMYKASLWKKSGHWENYAENMFSVATQDGSIKDQEIDEEWGLKPMNCPGHCLIFDSEPRSHRQLPIRYADFSALHRNENSGSLSGLTRVRRFHQDDGHIFCMPSQVEKEILKTLEFLELIYLKIFQLPGYRLVLSTRPTESYIGKVEEWNEAETQLKSALDATGQSWTLDEGEGAFYGPKIDVILKDAHGKEHQTATIQLDFQLPQRFGLQYQSAESGASQESPVLIHRAIFGSLERFLALLIEHYAGAYPFWLSPRPITILTVTTSEEEIAYADGISKYWSGISGYPSVFDPSQQHSNQISPQPIMRPALPITVDPSARPLREKIRAARDAGFNFICVVGPKDIESRTVSIDIVNQKGGEEAWAKYISANNSTENNNKTQKRFVTSVAQAKNIWNSLRDAYR